MSNTVYHYPGDATAIKIAPSILSADFTPQGEEVAEAEAAGADYIHIDVTDGHFVLNITVGPLMARAMRQATVNPGFGRQKFIESSLRRIRRLRDGQGAGGRVGS